MEQWSVSEDCCGNTHGITGLADVLQQRCRCGLLSWKLRQVEGRVVTQVVPESSWIGVLTHQLKEQALQRFFRGSAYMQACGKMEVSGETTKRSFVVLDDPAEGETRTDDVRNHLCFVCSEDMESGRVVQCLRSALSFDPEQLTSKVKEPAEKSRNRNNMLSHG